MRLAWPMLAIGALLSRPAQAVPEDYARNEGIRTDTTVSGGVATFAFGFHDTTGAYREWGWSTPAGSLDASGRAFGMYGKDPHNLRYTSGELRAGLFKTNPRVGLMPDYSALVSRYYDSVTELHRQWRDTADRQGLDRRQSLELLLEFLQDFPYGRPELVYEGRLIGGLFVPPLIFKYDYGDCDSKSLLMAAVLAHEPSFDGKAAMILVPGHALLGIEIEAGPYDEVYTYQNRNYVVAEPTGLARTPLGRKNSPYSSVLLVEPLERHGASGPVAATAPPRPVGNPGVSTLDFTPVRDRRSEPANGPGAAVQARAVRALTRSDCGARGVLTDTKSAITGIRVQTCFVTQGRDIVKNGPEVEYDEGGAPIKRTEYRMGRPVR